MKSEEKLKIFPKSIDPSEISAEEMLIEQNKIFENSPYFKSISSTSSNILKKNMKRWLFVDSSHSRSSIWQEDSENITASKIKDLNGGFFVKDKFHQNETNQQNSQEQQMDDLKDISNKYV
jgi:hypothetical protein